MNYPPIFRTNVEAAYGEAGIKWLTQLDSLIEDLSKQWDFHFIKEMPDLSYHFVALVEFNANQKTAILKTAPKGGTLIEEVRWLKSFKKSVPLVYQVDEECNAFLMERLEPGFTLKTLVQKNQDEEATRIICQTILDLHSEEVKSSAFKPLSELAKDLLILRGHIDRKILSKAESLFRELSTVTPVLLHGDLHHDNILASGSGWKAIDPHGYMGDPVAEVGAMIRNPFDAFPSYQPLKNTIETRLRIMAEMLPFDPKRMQAWCFCLTILSVAWTFEGFKKIDHEHVELASIVDKINI